MNLEKVPFAVVIYDDQEIEENIIKELKKHNMTVAYSQISITDHIARKAEKGGRYYLVTRMDEGGYQIEEHSMQHLL